ncbi:putative membrane protein [Nocardia sp. GAS34]|uniref:DUF998 domain-containing protein n=1 Tax=unclassified Nocardia TaxID=2637762 RepID=UPI003D2542E3
MFASTRPPAAIPPTRRLLPLTVAAGPLLFTLAWIVLGCLSPGYTLWGHTFTHYSPISQSISGLGIGVTAPWMNTAFILSGLLLSIGVVAVFDTIPDHPSRARTRLIVLLAASGIGVVMDGVFTLRQIMPHTLGFLLAVGTPIISFPMTGSYLRKHPRWRSIGTLLHVAGPLTLLLTIAYFATFTPTADGAEHGIAGLVERVLATEVLLCFAILGIHATTRKA